MSKVQRTPIAPLPPPRADAPAAPAAKHEGLRSHLADTFEQAKYALGSLATKAEHAIEGHAGQLGFEVHDADGDAAGHIDNDGFVLHSAGGKTTATPTATTANTNVQYYGGKVLNQFNVQNVYLGSYWNLPEGQADASKNDAFMKNYVSNDQAQSIWHQYGVQSGTYSGSQVVSKTIHSGQKITQRTIEDAVKKLAAADPNPGPNKLYNVVLPPGAVLSDGSATSLQGLGGYHGSVTVNGQPVYYSAIAYSKGNNGIDFTNGNAVDNVTITESHEISEAVTDPDVEVASKTNNWSALGWMDPQNGEIGDMEVNDAAPGTPLSTMYGTNDAGFAVQKIWSQQDQKNEISAVKPGSVQPLPAPTKPPA
jgi:hypothetical protein